MINQGSENLSRGPWRCGGHVQETWKLLNLLKPVKMTGQWSLTWLLVQAWEKSPHPAEVWTFHRIWEAAGTKRLSFHHSHLSRFQTPLIQT